MCAGSSNGSMESVADREHLSKDLAATGGQKRHRPF